MKSIITFAKHLAILILCNILPSITKAQLFENTLGNLAGLEDVWDSKPLSNGAEYALLSNTLSYSAASQILVTRLNAAGNYASAFSLYDPANPNDAYVAKGMEVDLSAAGAPTGFFVTGHRLSGNSQQLIVIRTDLNGVVTWAKRLNNVVNNVTYTESGISIERQSNGEIVVIGVSYDPGAVVYRPIAARLVAATGANVWANTYRYTTAAGQTFYPNESCNGTVNGSAVVAITGKYSDANAAGGRSFAFLINAANGNEVWANRRIYQSGALNNDGQDIVQNPATGRFMMVGQIFDNAGNPDLWVVNINTAGTVFNSASYDLGANYLSFVGRDVCLNAAGTSAVIAGYVKSNGPIGGVASNRAFAMELGFGAAGAPANATWTYSYTDSDPNPAGSESIERITGANGGYFIGTDAYLTGAGNFDQHAIRINAVGLHGLADCPENALQPARIIQGTTATKTKNKVNATWLNLTPNKSARDMIQEACDGVPFNGGEVGERSDEMQNAEYGIRNGEPARVFPNPASGDATLRLGLDSGQLVQVEVFDLGGRMVFSSEETLPEGNHDLTLPAAEWQPGAYLVRIVSQQGRQMLKLNVQR